MNTKFSSMVGKATELTSDFFAGNTMERLMAQRGLFGAAVDEHKVKHAVRKAMLGLVATGLADAAARQGVAMVALTDDEEKDVVAALGNGNAPVRPARPRAPRAPRVRAPKRKKEEAFSDGECQEKDPEEKPEEKDPEEKPEEKETEVESSGEETVIASSAPSAADAAAAKERARAEWVAAMMAPA